MDKEMLSELDKLEKENLSDKAKTEYYKKKFIEELKLGLGEEIKKNPNKVTVLKKSTSKRLMESIREKIIYIFKMF